MAFPEIPNGDRLINNLGFESADSFSGGTLLVETSVYISESVTLNYNAAITGNAFPSGAFEVLEFQDNVGNPLGPGCTIDTGALVLFSGTQSCSIGLVLVSAGSTVSVNNSLEGSIDIQFLGDTSAFNGTATVGPLQVYDLNGNLIDTVNVNDLTLTPEPSGLFLRPIGLGVIAATRLKLRHSSVGLALYPQNYSKNTITRARCPLLNFASHVQMVAPAASAKAM